MSVDFTKTDRSTSRTSPIGRQAANGMRLSKSFVKTRKQYPRSEISKSAQLLIRSGFIHKEMAGVYSYLPLGLKVLNKITQIVREEMNAAGGEELLLTTLQSQQVWQRTDRWRDDVIDVWFKTKLHSGTELGLATTHEEPLTALAAEYINSYRDLPCYIYQFQTKFRNELRAKSGILRTREFLMKDLYSFSRDQKEHDKFYERMKGAYMRVFVRSGLGGRTFMTFASGGSFSRYSHEFQTVCEAGEDTIYLSRQKKLAINKEVYNPRALKDLGVSRRELEEVKAVEVGNIFPLGTKFSEPLRLTFTDEKGREKPVIMGSYGIGPGRVMGTIVEIFHDENGIIWPEAVAPAQIHIVTIGGAKQVTQTAEKLYQELLDKGIEVIFDDRDESPGVKLADADLIGIPWRVVVSEKTLAKSSVELTARASKKELLIKTSELASRLQRG